MIFLHSSFRTSSTYIWSRFRQASNCIAYYEVFHELLASITQQQISSIRSDAWNSQHPPGAPYFLEFLPLIQEQGGVAGFDPNLGYGDFVPASGPSGPAADAQAAYVRTLVDHAEQRGRVPVLTDTRTLGRVAGLKAVAPGTHAVIYRNLLRQWCSYTDQATCGNAYFLDTIIKTARHSQHDPVIRDLLRMFPVEGASATDINTFYLFVFLHIHLYAHATASADFVIDVDRLANEAPYRAEIEEFFAEQNVRVDFPDASPSTAFSLVTFPCRREMLEQIQIISDAIIGKMPSERGRAFAGKVVTDLMDEHERHEFYSKRLRSVLLSTRRDRDQAVATAEGLRGQAADLQGERDRLGVERDTAVAAVETGRREADALRSEYDAILRDRLAIESEHRRLSQELASVSALCDRLTGERDAALAAWEDADRERLLITSRFDALLHWSVAFHDSTTASASWRLTWFLRWLGLGRPKRPPKPDFL